LALPFEESYVGSGSGQIKIKSEYTILFEYAVEIIVEFTNSRLSRKKAMKINAGKVEEGNRLSTSELRHNWTNPVSQAVTVFSMCPDRNGSASDLLINGKDFISYVVSVDEECPIGVWKSGYEVLMYFKIRAHPAIGKNRPASTF
jgi:hypothetical protein